MNTCFQAAFRKRSNPNRGSSRGHLGLFMAILLTAIYGENFAFTDNSHVGRPKDVLRNVEFKARSFTSFVQAAQESADSRFYGNIHTHQDNETGLSEGKKIGANVNALVWQK